MVLRLGTEQRAAHRLTQDVFGAAGAPIVRDELELSFHLAERETGRAFDALELPLLFDLIRGARIGRLAVGLGAAAKAEEVIIEGFVVRVDLRTALIARA